MSAAPPPFSKLSILVAAYNEQETLRLSIDTVLAAPLPAGIAREIVIVIPPHSPALLPVLAVLGPAGAKANS